MVPLPALTAHDRIVLETVRHSVVVFLMSNVFLIPLLFPLLVLTGNGEKTSRRACTTLTASFVGNAFAHPNLVK